MDKNLNINVKANSKVIETLNKELDRTYKELTKLEKQGKTNTREYKAQVDSITKLTNQLNSFQKSSQNATKQASGLSSALAGGLAGGFAVVAAQMIPFVLNSIKTGAALSNLRAGFAGTAKDLDLLRKATANTVSEAGLIALSNQAMDLGISLENQAKLFSLAEDAGDKYGGSLEENFQKIVLATDGSARGLRAVGVSATEFKKKVEELVKVQGVKLEQLSAEEQLQIRLQAIFELTGTTMDSITNKTVDAADALEQLGLVAETAASSFGEGLVNAFMTAGEGAKNFSIDLEMISAVAKGIGEDFGKMARDIVDAFDWAGEKIRDFFEWTMSEELKQQRRVDLRLQQLEKESIEANQFGPFISDEQRAGLKTRATTRTQSTPGGSTANKTTEKAKELLTAIDEIQKKIAEKQEIQSLYLNKGLTTTQAYLILLEEIVSLETQLASLRGGAVTSLEAMNVPRLPIGEVSFTSTTGVEEALQAERDKAIEDGKMIYGNVTNILNTLGLATDNFVGSIVSGFNTVLAIMESIKAINTILNVIPFLATGGIMQSSGLAVVGERGPELVSLPAGARVYNNQDTQKYFNSINSTPQAVNVYVNANLDGLQFLENNMPKYFDKRNFKRIN